MKRVDLKSVRDANLLGKDDPVLVRYATRENRIFLAADKGLSEYNYAVCTHAGILNVSKFNTRPETLKKKLSNVLSSGRRFLNHNVVHLGEDEYWVVEEGNRKRRFKYN